MTICITKRLVIYLEGTIVDGAVDATNLMGYQNDLSELLSKMELGSSCYLIPINLLIETFVGFQSCTTYTGTGIQFLFVMSTYVVVYETPAFGSHHFSPIFRSSRQEMKTPIKKPKWVTELQQNALQNDLDTVILMINCAAAAKMFFDRHLVHKTSSFQYPKLCM